MSMTAERTEILRLNRELIETQNQLVNTKEQLALYREELKGLVWLEKVNIKLRQRVEELELQLKSAALATRG